MLDILSWIDLGFELSGLELTIYPRDLCRQDHDARCSTFEEDTLWS